MRTRYVTKVLRSSPPRLVRVGRCLKTRTRSLIVRFATTPLAGVGRCLRVTTTATLCAVSIAFLPPAATSAEPPTVAVIVGAEGTPEYGEQFRTWAARWQEAAGEAGASCVPIGLEDASETTDREALRQYLASQPAKGTSPLWLVLIGHGTSYRDTANFNLRGPDVSSKELAKWLEGFERPLVVVNSASSSGPFVRDLAGPDRIVITATRSGAEQNYARFGDYLSQAITDPAADLDHDKQISLLEAFLSASGRTARFYEEEARLATEHALLEDNGDGLGTSADFYRGVRPVRAAQDDAPLDGRLAARTVLIPGDVDRDFTPQQLAQRAEIEQQIDRLRDRKAELDEEAYYDQLESLVIQLARLYEEVEQGTDGMELEGAPPSPVQ